MGNRDQKGLTELLGPGAWAGLGVGLVFGVCLHWFCWGNPLWCYCPEHGQIQPGTFKCFLQRLSGKLRIIIHNLEIIDHFVTYQWGHISPSHQRFSSIEIADEMDMTRCKRICRAADTLNMVRHIEVPRIVMALELSWKSPDISKILILLIQKSNI